MHKNKNKMYFEKIIPSEIIGIYPQSLIIYYRFNGNLDLLCRGGYLYAIQYNIKDIYNKRNELIEYSKILEFKNIVPPTTTTLVSATLHYSFSKYPIEHLDNKHLNIAIENNHFELSLWLYKHQKLKPSITSINIAISKGYFKIAKKFLSLGTKCNEQSFINCLIKNNSESRTNKYLPLINYYFENTKLSDINKLYGKNDIKSGTIILIKTFEGNLKIYQYINKEFKYIGKFKFLRKNDLKFKELACTTSETRRGRERNVSCATSEERRDTTTYATCDTNVSCTTYDTNVSCATTWWEFYLHSDKFYDFEYFNITTIGGINTLNLKTDQIEDEKQINDEKIAIANKHLVYEIPPNKNIYYALDIMIRRLFNVNDYNQHILKKYLCEKNINFAKFANFAKVLVEKYNLKMTDNLIIHIIDYGNLEMLKWAHLTLNYDVCSNFIINHCIINKRNDVIKWMRKKFKITI